jgi:hypothetical protein
MNQPVLMPVHSLAAAVLAPLGLLGLLALLALLAPAALGLLAPLGLLALLAPAVLEAPDCGCLRGSTVRDPYRIWERLGPLFCK